MEKNESIQSMIANLQTMPNNLRSIGTIYCNYDHNDKVLCTLPPNWRT